MQSQNSKMIFVHFQGKPLNITVIQVYTPTTNDKEADVEWFYDDLKDLLCVSRSVVPDSLQPHGLQPIRLLCT